MSAEDSKDDGFLSEFIDDLYAEYDERLGLIRKGLLSLETFVDKPITDETLIDGLLRHAHTLKGLAATVSIENAEQLIHHTESYLRTLQKNQVQLSTAGMETLFDSFKCLEQIIAAFRANTPLPSIQTIVDTLTQLTTAVTPEPKATLPPDPISKDATSSPRPVQLWCFNFRPSLTLAKKGININAIRKRLESIGEIIQAVPQVQSDGKGVAFEFLVSTQQQESDFAAWGIEGLTFHLYQDLSPPKPVPEVEMPQPVPVEADDAVASLAQSNTVRVELTRLDELMRIVGELVTTRARQTNYLEQMRGSLPQTQWRVLQETNLTLERQLRELREHIMRVRLIPIGHTFERMKFIIRDTANATKKQVKLILKGQETEVDKLIVDKMVDPLLHLVRNAVSHGIESPAQRKAKGKAAEGQIILKAYTAGDAIVIEIEDDGQGIAVDAVIQRARTQNLLSDTMPLENMALLEILCKAGFSTLEQADLTSGRGIGMDVVKNAVAELGGTLAIHTQVDQGTRFTIQLPLTLAIADVLLITVAGQKFAVPQLSVREVIEIKKSTITRFENNEIIKNREKIIPLIRLTRLFKLPETDKDSLQVLIVGSLENIGIVVDNVLGKFEIVVRALKDPLVQCPGVSGASELGDGQVILILDVSTLVGLTQQRETAF